MSGDVYARLVEHERWLGLAYVRIGLDRLCEEAGLGFAAWRDWETGH